MFHWLRCVLEVDVYIVFVISDNTLMTLLLENFPHTRTQQAFDISDS